jgi:hypothetical protein
MKLTKEQKQSIAAGSTRPNIKNVAQSVLNENEIAKNRQQAAARASQSTNTTKLEQAETKIARYQYPSDLSQYYIGFSFSEYSRPKFNVRPTKSIKADISLPIPNNLTDFLEARWDEQEMGFVGHFGEAGGALADSAGVNNTVGRTIGAVGGAFAEQYYQNQFQFNEAAKKGLSEALRLNGLAFNPYLAMYYNGPRFKKHRFAWRFSPNHPGESRDLVQIIKQFHFAMSPELTAGGIFFKYPFIVNPKIFNGDQPNDFLYDFKSCVIENVVVNYAPSGVPSFFAGTKAPTEIEFQLFLSEISLWLKEDYAD